MHEVSAIGVAAWGGGVTFSTRELSPATLPEKYHRHPSDRSVVCSMYEYISVFRPPSNYRMHWLTLLPWLRNHLAF